LTEAEQIPKHWPAVTVILNTYERASLLSRALDSVLAQTFTDYELIVVHDGPMSDATKHVLEEYTTKFEQAGRDIYVIALTENSGYQCIPKNAAIEPSTGDYIAYLDDDNEWLPCHLETLVAAIEEGVVWPDFVYGRREYVLDDPTLCGPSDMVLPTGPSVFHPLNEDNLKRLAAGPQHNFIDTSEILFSKGGLYMLAHSTGTVWNESLRRFGDWELVARALFYGGLRGKGVDKVVQRYHWTGNNLQLTRPANEAPVMRREGSRFGV